MRRKWASCSSRGILTLSADLLRLPLDLVEYVVCHERYYLRRPPLSPIDDDLPLTPNGIPITCAPADPSAGLVVTAHTVAEARREPSRTVLVG